MSVSINRRSMFRASSLALGMVPVMLSASPAQAQSVQKTTANTTTADGAVSVSLNGNIFVNQGLVGAGRLDAATRDFANETLGSFSGMAMDLRSWRRNADGSYVGNIYTLPDRGPNDVGPFVGTTNYRNRVHTSRITFKPYTSTTVLPQATASQNQVTITPTGGFFLTDTTGTNFTGKDAGDNVITRNGVLYPQVASGDGTGRISMDSEAIAFRPDGTFYVSDEYAANIYYFDATGKQIGALNTVNALLPKTSGGTVSFNGAGGNVTGRRNNQGLEALAITPDNKRLVTILQSATLQDTNGSSQQTRNNTRILVYDIANSAIPNANPIGHYVLQLPIFDQNGAGASPNRTAAQSEMLALNSNQFLVLSRDGIGRGASPTSSTTPIFKSVLLVDITGATNLVDTPYEDAVTPIATAGSLVSGIVPAAQVELVNMLNVTQLNRFGMNLNTQASTVTSLSEKWEALGLAPVLEENAPQDFFLFIGNDNDFVTSNGFINGQAFDASLTGAAGSGSNDSVLLVYRLSLPTYVDPLALEALNTTAPSVLYGSRAALNGLAASTTRPAMQFLNAQRGWAGEDNRRFRIWADLGFNQVGTGGSPVGGLELDTFSFTMGLDAKASEAIRIGLFGGYRKLEGHDSLYAPRDASAWTAGAYLAADLPQGFYGHASVGMLGNARLKDILRPSAYGQTATGTAHGQGWAISGELGWKLQQGPVSLTPFAALDYTDMKLDGWKESGASVSNLTFPDRKFRKLAATFGGEAGFDIGKLKATARAGYTFENESGDNAATVKLASAQHVMGTVMFPLADTERDSVLGELRLVLHSGPITAYVVGSGRWGRGRDDASVSGGLSYAF